MKEPSILQGLADNTPLTEAVKQLILKQFAEVPYAEGASDELLGQLTRARIVGRQKVEMAFRELESHKSPPKVDNKDNPAF